MVERYRGRVSEGMQVRSADGEKLGKVVACQPNGFVVEKGFLFPRDLIVPYERITGVANGEIVISLARADLSEPGAARAGAASGLAQDVKDAGKGIKEAVAGAVGEARASLGGEKSGDVEAFGKAAEVTVSLAEEEIVTSKHVEKIGDVHVRKEVITEEKQITVPVSREVLRIERVPVNHEARAGDKTFEKESYDIPISEEHVDIQKRTVVREEVRIGKEVQRGEETASATLRRERADIETAGPVRRAEVPSNDTTELRPTGTGGSRR